MVQRNNEEAHISDFPYGKIILGVIMIAIAFWVNGIFNDLETGVRESARIHWIIAIAYKSIGPTLTVTILGLIGIALVLGGIFQFFRKRN
jgi:hypothetical protein